MIAQDKLDKYDLLYGSTSPTKKGAWIAM